MSARARVVWAKVAVWGGALLPFGRLLRGIVVGDLGADPVETLLHQTGTWGLILLLVTLSVTPIRRITGWNRLVKLRRLLGLFAYFYAALHVGVYLVLDQGLAPAFILEDVAERPYVTAGAAAFLILSLLALTSTRGWIRRLGRRWQRLHRLVYLAGALVVLHFLWQVKADPREALIFAAAYAALILFRVPWRRLRPDLPEVGGKDRGAPTPTPTPER